MYAAQERSASANVRLKQRCMSIGRSSSSPREAIATGDGGDPTENVEKGNHYNHSLDLSEDSTTYTVLNSFIDKQRKHRPSHIVSRTREQLCQRPRKFNPSTESRTQCRLALFLAVMKAYKLVSDLRLQNSA